MCLPGLVAVENGLKAYATFRRDGLSTSRRCLRRVWRRDFGQYASVILNDRTAALMSLRVLRVTRINKDQEILLVGFPGAGIPRQLDCLAMDLKVMYKIS